MVGARVGRAATTLIRSLLLAALLTTPGAARPLGVVDPCTEPDGSMLRVVSLVPAVSTMLVEMGLGRCVVGRATDDRTEGSSGAVAVGVVVSPDAERIIALRPTVVFAWAVGDRRALAEALERGAGRLVRLRLDRLADVPGHVRNLGVALDREPVAETLAASLEAELAGLAREVAATRALHHAPRILWVVGLEPPLVAGPGGIADDLLTFAGGTNVFADAPNAWFRPSLEQLRSRTVDLVVWPVGGDLPGMAGLSAESPWRALDAVHSGRVLEVDSDLVHEAGPRAAEAARLLFELMNTGVDPVLHPPQGSIR